MQTEYADKRFARHTSNEIRAGPSVTLQRKLVESKLASPKLDHSKQTPDITDFMNDLFFGTINGGDHPKRAYNLNGGDCTRGRASQDQDNDDFDSSTRSVSSRQTQEWLEEAKRMVASSPNSRGADSPTRFVGSPRFATSQARFSASSIDRRDPLSRSARRNRALEGFSSEILSKTATHTRKRSETNLDPPPQQNGSPTSDAQNWVSSDPTPPSPTSNPGGPPLPPRQSTHRRTRFQAPAPQTIPALPANISLSKRTFKSTPITSNSPSRIPEAQLLSPPKHLVESAHRRSVSSSTCSVPDPAGIFLSPLRNLVESAHRRSVSSSTCRTDRNFRKDNSSDDGGGKLNGRDLINGFLKQQRVKIEKLLSGEINGRAKIVLSGPSNSTSSMVAATCYAWLSENKMRANKSGNDFEFVVPVMNIRRGQMWKHSQAAWLFDHVGLDATSLLFANEVDLETLMMSMQLSMLVVGEDILKTNGEVGSSCTVLTDHYCEDAYDLLQTPILKQLLLAGILLDTKNLSTSPKLSMARDAEAVQLLSVSSAPNYRNTLYDQLVQDQRDNDFFEALCRTYGKPPSELKWDGRISEMKIPSDKFITQNESNDARTKKVSPISGKPRPSPIPTPVKPTAKPNEDPSRGKNRNFFAKLFGFGSK
ncbi:hypothetical protein ABFS82_09G013400 [Erythranthe guttata]|uniref:uncharacterized protein LOC105974917 n=1 Tax=Erythranthe guttata TaxID=4155 RepID=UPI00064D7353|nr:PREDICTED: uncharacterized protein LOC105974917 [Erythranthe guttata]|eukprot:XP_012855529.1 PREDICTED: uncharacterized protein LOC105974917 [Erythranthe guttata]